ncbi:MAG TPA: FAD binding domain-containing protein [Anaerolineae bacterium]|nr:FAD binding domain-containing protein [Anaerolineae bacterium]
MPIRHYQRPKDLAAAQAALRQPGAAPLMLGPRIPAEPFAAMDTAVDLRLLDLAYIREDGEGIHIGALTPLQDIAESSQLESQAGGILPEAAGLAAHLGLRHLATLGGSLSWPDIAVVLLALEAVVVAVSAQKRETPLADFQAAEGELILEVKFSAQTGAGGALARVARTPRDEAIVCAAAVVTKDTARVAVAGASPQSIVRSSPITRNQLTNNQLLSLVDAITSAAHPAGDYRASAEYRKAMAGVLARRALSSLSSSSSLSSFSPERST